MGKNNRQTLHRITMSQIVGVLDAFDIFFNQEKFKQIIELGTGSGGFSTYLAFYMLLVDGTFHTFDHKKARYSHLIEKLDGHVHVMNIKKNEQTIIDKINSPVRTLLLCDNGNKINEINTYARHIKKNDFIMAHDFFFSGNVDSVDWSCEITNNDIKKVILQTKLIYKYRDIFDPVLWCCLTKKI